MIILTENQIERNKQIIAEMNKPAPFAAADLNILPGCPQGVIDNAMKKPNLEMANDLIDRHGWAPRRELTAREIARNKLDEELILQSAAMNDKPMFDISNFLPANRD